MFKRQIFTFVCLFAVAKSGAAIQLEEFVSDVVRSHPQVIQQIHIYRQVVQDESISGKGWRPSVDLTASTGVYSTKSPLTGFDENNYESHDVALTLTQNLFNGYDTTNAGKQARARIASELQRVYDEADNIALKAIAGYIEALKQRDLVELAELNVKSHEMILRKIRERNDSGAGRRSEEEQTQGRLAQARASLLAQQNNLQDALTRVHFNLGRYVLAEELVNPNVPVIPSQELDWLLDQALANHPAMKSALYNIDASDFDYKRAESKFYPKVDLQLKTMFGEDIGGYDGSTDEHSAVINLSYNLYNGGADKSGKQKKLSGVYEHREYAAKVRRQIIETLRLAWMAGKTLNSQLKYLDEYVEKSNRTYGFYREEFFVGQRDLLDLLDAEGERNTAKVNRAKAYYDAQTASFRIYEGMGELFKVLALDVEIAGDDLRLVSINVGDIDTLPFDPDGDADKERDVADHCDNTLPSKLVNDYGCIKEEEVSGLRLGELHLEHLNFVFDSAELTEESATRLTNIVIPDLKRVAVNAYIEIYAHTDSMATSKYNQMLSQRRAEKIKSILVESGFDPLMITAVGRGEFEPIAENISELGRAKNRRVEFLVEEAGLLRNKDSKTSPLYPRANPVSKLNEEKKGVQYGERSGFAGLKLNKLNFVYESNELTDESYEYLKNVIMPELKKWAVDSYVEIQAHTDSKGEPKYNLALSQRRADKVKSILVELGFNAATLRATGRGDYDPMGENKTEEGRAANRRVEFFVRDMKGK
jgi:adhesin transport system outer membrane protein